MKSYVTYDEAGNLTGFYQQELAEAHVDKHIVLDEPLALHWTRYAANAQRDGVVELPEPVPVVRVPSSVTRRQARQALLLAGLLDDVQPAINAIPDTVQRGMAQIEWDDSQEFQRQRPLVVSIGLAIGLDSDALDQLFITAAGL